MPPTMPPSAVTGSRRRDRRGYPEVPASGRSGGSTAASRVPGCGHVSEPASPAHSRASQLLLQLLVSDTFLCHQLQVVLGIHSCFSVPGGGHVPAPASPVHSRAPSAASPAPGFGHVPAPPAPGRSGGSKLLLEFLAAGTFLPSKSCSFARAQLLLQLLVRAVPAPPLSGRSDGSTAASRFLAAGTLLHQVGFSSFGQFLGIRIRPWPAFSRLARALLCLGEASSVVRCLTAS